MFFLGREGGFFPKKTPKWGFTDEKIPMSMYDGVYTLEEIKTAVILILRDTFYSTRRLDQITLL